MSVVPTRPFLLAMAVAGVMTAAPAFAMGDWPHVQPGHPGHPGRHGPTQMTSAPEIDAGSGLAALAAVLAGLAFAWERRRAS